MHYFEIHLSKGWCGGTPRLSTPCSGAQRQVCSLVLAACRVLPAAALAPTAPPGAAGPAFPQPHELQGRAQSSPEVHEPTLKSATA